MICFLFLLFTSIFGETVLFESENLKFLDLKEWRRNILTDKSRIGIGKFSGGLFAQTDISHGDIILRIKIGFEN
jgi:hypothetical protein